MFYKISPIFGIPGVISKPKMSNTQDAKLEQINAFLAGSITELIKYPKCKLYFESNAEAHMEGKTRKSCMVYIIGDSILICRPRKYGKKFYVKYQFPVSRVRVCEEYTEKDKELHSTSLDIPLLLSHRNRMNVVTYYYIWFCYVWWLISRLPSCSLNSTFLNCVEECYEDFVNRDAIHTFWHPFPCPLFFSYHNELMQRYSTVEVSNAGSPDVNGTYYPVGWQNKSFVWKNNQNIFISRELVGNELGWIFGNITVVYYGICSKSLFLPSDSDWTCYSGKPPSPCVVCHQAGSGMTSFDLQNQAKSGVSSVNWTVSLTQEFL